MIQNFLANSKVIHAIIDYDYNCKCNDKTNDEARRKEELSHYVQNSG